VLVLRVSGLNRTIFQQSKKKEELMSMRWVLVQAYDFGGMMPGFGGGWGGGPRPDQGLPPGFGGGHPDHDLPWGPGHPGNWVPGSWGGRPDNSLPWAPGHPGNRPPGSWGGPVDPGFGQGGGRPDQGLPGGRPDHPWLPSHGGGDRPDQGLPPGASPKTPYGSAVALAPPETVNATEGAWVLVNVQGTLVWAWAQKPEAPAKPGNELPGGAPPRPGNELPEGGAAPKK
jgi:hypothetical protein